MYVSKEGYTRFFFLFGDEKERSVLRVAMLLCSEKKNEIDFGQLHLIPHPLLLSRSLARALSLCLSISLSLSLFSRWSWRMQLLCNFWTLCTTWMCLLA